MHIFTRANEIVMPIEMASEIIGAKTRIINPKPEWLKQVSKALTGHEEKNVIEIKMFNTKELKQIAEFLLMHVRQECGEFQEEYTEDENEAMEKQIPKVPAYEGDGYADGVLVYDEWLCPNCDSRFEVDYEEYEYCPKCGQHIDHSKFGKE